MNLRDIKESIEEDIASGVPVEIIDESGDCIKVFDDTECGREYALYDPNKIDAGWIAQRIIETPAASSLRYRVSARDLASYLSSNVSPEFMMTLSAIVILGDDYDDDYTYLSGIGDFKYELEGSDLPVDELGLHWYSYNKVFIHMGNIIAAVDEEYEQLRIDEWDILPEINLNVLTTLVHEIRHLAQANPYIPDDVLMQRSDDETDAEEYARRIVGSFPLSVVYEP